MSYKVSIIIPVYNAADFIIDETINSIENQTMDFDDIEVILVNDCSSDDTEEILNEYAVNHPNIVPIHLRNNAGGPAIPRNIGITYASADYLMFLDQDDKFQPNACEVLYNTITEENVDVVCGNNNLVVNGVANKSFDYEWAEEDFIKIDSVKDNPNFLSISVLVWSKIFRKDFVLKNNIKFLPCVAEDLFFSFRSILLANGVILLKNFIVVDYNVRDDSLSHQIDKDYLIEYTNVYLDLFNYCEINIEDEYYQPLFASRMNQLLSILFYSNIYYDEMIEVLRVVQELFKKIYSKNFYFEDKLNNLLYNTIIDDNSSFENSIFIYSSIKSKKSYNFNNSIKYLNHECKLYIDSGSGYNEKDCITIMYKLADEIEVEFDLTDFSEINRIRFDPISKFFIDCEIMEISSNKGFLLYKPTNAFNISKSDTFITTDSQYQIIGDLSNLEYIKIKFSVDLLTNNTISKLLNSS